MEDYDFVEYYNNRQILKSDWFRQMGVDVFMQKEYNIFKKFYLEKMLSDTIKESDIKEYQIRKAWSKYRIYEFVISGNHLNFHNMKEIPYRQKTSYGCPIYCFANLFNDKSIIDDYLPNFIDRGLNFVDESIILSKISKNNNFDNSYYLLPIIVLGADSYFSDVNINYFSGFDSMLIKDDELSYMIFMVGVTGTLNHRILVIKQLFSDNYYVIDPLKSHVIRTDYATLNLLYDIFCFAVIHKDGLAEKEFIIVENNMIKHLI